MTLKITLYDEPTNQLVGFHVIHATPSRALDGDALGRLQAADHLLPVFMAMASLGQTSDPIALMIGRNGVADGEGATFARLLGVDEADVVGAAALEEGLRGAGEPSVVRGMLGGFGDQAKRTVPGLTDRAAYVANYRGAPQRAIESRAAAA